MEQEIVFTNQPETEIAVKELIQQLKNIPDKYDAVLFFASSEYDFSLLSSLLHDKFCNAEVIGTTTSGEISNSGFTKNYIMCHFDQEGKVGQIVEAEIIGEINGEAKAKII